MPRKSKTTAPKRKKTPPYPSLLQGPTPAERREALRKQAAERGVRPMTGEELEQLIEDHREIWPDDEEIDEFIAWLHKARREGRYS